MLSPKPLLAAWACSAFILTGAPARSQSTATFTSELRTMGLEYRGPREFKVAADRRWGSWPGTLSAQWILTADSKPVRVRLKASSNIEPENAAKEQKLQISRIDYLYIGNAAYPGMITRQFEVPTDLKPESVQESSSTGKVLLLYATPSLSYGAGSRDLIAYRAVLGFRYCRERKVLVTVELFYPKDGFDRSKGLDELRDFECAAPQ